MKDFLFVVLSLAFLTPKNISAADNEPNVSPDLMMPQDLIQLTEQLVEDVAEVEEEKREEESQVSIASQLGGDPFVWGMGVMAATAIRYVVNEVIQKPGLTAAQSMALNRNRKNLESAKAELLAALEHFDREAGNKGLISKAWQSSKDFANGIVTGVLKKSADQNLRRLGEDRDLRKTSQDVRAKFDRFMAEVERSRIDEALGKNDAQLEKFHEIESRLEESLKRVADKIITSSDKTIADSDLTTLVNGFSETDEDSQKGLLASAKEGVKAVPGKVVKAAKKIPGGLRSVGSAIVSAPANGARVIREIPTSLTNALHATPAAISRLPRAAWGFLIMSEAWLTRKRIREASQRVIETARAKAADLSAPTTKEVLFHELVGNPEYKNEIKTLLERAHAHKMSVLEGAQKSEETELTKLKASQLLKSHFADPFEWMKMRAKIGEDQGGSSLGSVLVAVQKQLNDDDKKLLDAVLEDNIKEVAAEKFKAFLDRLNSQPEKAAAFQKYFKEQYPKSPNTSQLVKYRWGRIREELSAATNNFNTKIKAHINSKVPGQIRAENDFLEKFYEATGRTKADKRVPAESKELVNSSQRRNAFYDRIRDMELDPDRYQPHERVIEALSQMEDELKGAASNEKNERFLELAREAKKYSIQYLNIAKRKKQKEEELSFHKSALENIEASKAVDTKAGAASPSKALTVSLAERGMASKEALPLKQAPSLLRRCLNAVMRVK